MLDQKPLQTKEVKVKKEPKNIVANQPSNTHSAEEKTPAPKAPVSNPTT